MKKVIFIIATVCILLGAGLFVAYDVMKDDEAKVEVVDAVDSLAVEPADTLVIAADSLAVASDTVAVAE